MSTLEMKLCVLAHSLNDGLGVIAGEVQLLEAHLKDKVVDPSCARRLRSILEMVEVMASRINGYECRMFSCPAQDAGETRPGTTSKQPVCS
jgi:nitrogen-specific signal transduction histidine kinase